MEGSTLVKAAGIPSFLWPANLWMAKSTFATKAQSH